MYDIISENKDQIQNENWDQVMLFLEEKKIRFSDSLS